MLAGVERPRKDSDFQSPAPSAAQRFRALVAAAPAYAEGIDESKYQYMPAPKWVNHAAALAGGVTFTVIRVSNCTTVDPYFEQAWTDAMAAGLPIMIFANVQGYASGLAQAEFAIRTAEPFIKACKTKVVIWGDFEEDWMTMSVAARQKLALDFLNGIHAHYETGIYSNWKYWNEMYGNLKPPAWAWLWGAHWTSAASGTFPSSWDLSKLLIWQYGVWDNQTWALPVPGNQPDIDKDRWMWNGGSVGDFLALPQPPPPPTPEPGEHEHPEIAQLQAETASLREAHNDAVNYSTELNRRIVALTAEVISLKNRVEVLEDKPTTPPASGVLFTIVGSRANLRRVNGYDGTRNEQYPNGKPIMVIQEPRMQFDPPAVIRVDPAVVTATGGEKYHRVMGYDNPLLYVRKQDGVLG